MSKQQNVTKDFLVVVLIVILGKALGLFRELVVSYLYGSSIDTDAFYYVNSLITAMFSIITMGLGQAFTPTYLDINIKRGSKESTAFVNKIVSILTAIGIVISILLLVFPQYWITFLAPDLNFQTSTIAVKMLKTMAPCVPVYVLFSIRKCILNAHQKYIITEASGIPYSIAIALLTFLLFDSMGNMALPIAALVGVVFQYVFTFCFSKKDYTYGLPIIHSKDSEIRNYFVMLAPIATSAVLEEANGLLRKALAGGMGEGAIANLSYCMTLTTLINGIVITSISTVYFPHLIKNYSEEDFPTFKKNASNCISMASVLVVPVVAYLMLFSKNIVRVVYERGSFTSSDTIQVSSLFTVYIVGSIVYAYRCIIKTAFFSTKNARTPMINEMLYLLICMVCNVVQVKVFNMGLEALGIAWVISITLMTPILFFQFKKKYLNLIDKNVILESLKAVISTVFFVIAVLIVKRFIVFSNNFIEIIVFGIIVLIIYAIGMIAMKSSTFVDILKALKRR